MIRSDRGQRNTDRQRETARHTDRQRQTYIHTDRETGRHTDNKNHIDTYIHT